LSSKFTVFVGWGSFIDHEAVNCAVQLNVAPAEIGELGLQLKPLNNGCPRTSWKELEDADVFHKLSPEYCAVIVLGPKAKAEEVGSKIMDALPCAVSVPEPIVPPLEFNKVTVPVGAGPRAAGDSPTLTLTVTGFPRKIWAGITGVTLAVPFAGTVKAMAEEVEAE
jgi:hypothetical protein